ncbi:MAG: protoheme IX farnesyltransferase, partial [Rhodocyclaceae bacterium]|nr:protoheme IX farnesyltransferase [Rhodocyclaceae bacterium]
MAETILTARPGPAERLRRYLRLTKPRVNTLIVFCAV